MKKKFAQNLLFAKTVQQLKTVNSTKHEQSDLSIPGECDQTTQYESMQ